MEVTNKGNFDRLFGWGAFELLVEVVYVVVLGGNFVFLLEHVENVLLDVDFHPFFLVAEVEQEGAEYGLCQQVIGNDGKNCVIELLMDDARACLGKPVDSVFEN